MSKIHNFAIKWVDKFQDSEINYRELVDHYMADDCAALGFEMDCAHAFENIYNKAAYDNKELAKIINKVTDIQLLGSAIYSRWRYFNHWAYNPQSILKQENRSWFIIALSRLALLTDDNIFIFQGIPKKMKIISNNICYGPCPKPGDEVEQHITINTDGQVSFSSYIFGNKFGKYKKSRSINFNIDKSIATELLGKVSYYFSQGYEELFVTDIGQWTLELTNIDGQIYRFQGSLCADFQIDLSDLIRDTLNLQDLYVFDGNNKLQIL